MTNINLLPWREELREDRKREFLITLGVVVAFAGALLFLADRYENILIDDQNSRNQYLTEQIAELDLKLVEIRELREQKALLTQRMAIIQDLEGARPLIVRMFDELVKTLPEDVYYNSISRVGDRLQLEGNAASNARVSELMLDLESSEWFSETRLGDIVAVPTEGSTDNESRIIFQLSVSALTTTLEQEVVQE